MRSYQSSIQSTIRKKFIKRGNICSKNLKERCQIYFNIYAYLLCIDIDGSDRRVGEILYNNYDLSKMLKLLKTLPTFVRKLCTKVEFLSEQEKEINHELIMLLEQLGK